MCDLPIAIPDDEKVIRAIKTQHLKPSGAVKPNALRPPPNESAASVIRNAMGDKFCKEKGKQIAGGQYEGLLSLRTSDVRAKGSQVLDFREGYFCGHAHVDHGIPLPPPGEPLAPELNDKLTEICREIISTGTYHKDPTPDAEGWSGPAL